jgi:hypothetical protein
LIVASKIFWFWVLTSTLQKYAMVKQNKKPKDQDLSPKIREGEAK